MTDHVELQKKRSLNHCEVVHQVVVGMNKLHGRNDDILKAILDQAQIMLDQSVSQVYPHFANTNSG
jgi:hypothetical protein